MGKSESTDIEKYIKKIYDKADLPLFEEAVENAKGGSLRSAYIMLWLACAESLKRRFNELKKYDHSAGKIVGEIKRREQQQKSIDKFLLDKAKDYGILSNSQYMELHHIYEKRCIYVHPYEEAPEPETVVAAANSTVQHLLSKPVKLRHGYCKKLLDDLLTKRHYFDDGVPSTVMTFAGNVVSRLDETIYEWLLDKYFSKLEEIIGDPSNYVYFYRGKFFCRAFLAKIGKESFSKYDWHKKFLKTPMIVSYVCCDAEIFGNIKSDAQDSIVGNVIEHPSLLPHLETLNEQQLLCQRQQMRFKDAVSKLNSETLSISKLKLKTVYDTLISRLKERNWYTQNPTVDYIASRLNQLSELSDDEQINLGRNILQAAQGKAREAINFIDSILPERFLECPENFILGMLLESFTNEKDKIRFKDHCLKDLLCIIDKLDSKDEFTAQVTESVRRGSLQLQDNMWKWNLGKPTKLLNEYTWAEPLKLALEE